MATTSPTTTQGGLQQQETNASGSLTPVLETSQNSDVTIQSNPASVAESGNGGNATSVATSTNTATSVNTNVSQQVSVQTLSVQGLLNLLQQTMQPTHPVNQPLQYGIPNNLVPGDRHSPTYSQDHVSVQTLIDVANDGGHNNVIHDVGLAEQYLLTGDPNSAYDTSVLTSLNHVLSVDFHLF